MMLNNQVNFFEDENEEKEGDCDCCDEECDCGDCENCGGELSEEEKDTLGDEEIASDQFGKAVAKDDDYDDGYRDDL